MSRSARWAPYAASVVIAAALAAGATYYFTARNGGGGNASSSFEAVLLTQPGERKVQPGLRANGLELRQDVWPYLYWSVGLAAAGAIIAAFFLTGRRSNVAGRDVEPRMARNEEFYQSLEVRAYPAGVLADPFGPDADFLSSEQRVALAIEASLQADRHLGVVFFPVLDAGLASAEPLRASLVQAIAAAGGQAGGPPARFCGELAEDGFLVAIGFLQTRDELYALAHRLTEAFRTLPDVAAAGAMTDPAAAIYPVDGYSAAELFASARSRAKAGAAAQLSLLRN